MTALQLRPRSRRALACVATAFLMILDLGGCTLTTRDRPPVSEKVSQVLEAGEGHFDLTRPPSRAEAGMPPGQELVAYEDDARPAFRVRASLPEGAELDVDAKLLVFDSYSAPNSKTASPTAMEAFHHPATLKDGLARLLGDVRAFHLDTDAVLAWYAEASGPPPRIDATVKSVWITTEIGYLTLSVQARYDRPQAAAGDPGQTIIQYSLSWPAS